MAIWLYGFMALWYDIILIVRAVAASVAYVTQLQLQITITPTLNLLQCIPFLRTQYNVSLFPTVGQYKNISSS